MTLFIRSWCALFLMAALLRAQEDSLAARWLELAEKDPSVAEQLQRFTLNPLNLNRVRREDLIALPFISHQTADTIVSYRRTHGRFKTVYPLRKILGADLYRIVKPFFTIRSKRRLKGYWIQKNYFLPDPSAASSAYEGSLWSNYTRVEYALNDTWKAGLLFRKDAGEADWFDYTTGYVSYSGNGQWILGNFRLQSGTGLVFGSPFSGQKSSMVMLPLRGNGGIKLNAGLSPALNSLFGVSHIRRFGPFTVAVFAAQNILDARLAGAEQAVVGIDYDGYHRTPSERKGQNRISRQSAGLSVSVPLSRSLNLSAIGAHYAFTPAVRRDGEVLSEAQQRKDYYAFAGSALNVFSLSYQYEDSVLLLSGEGAGSDMGGPAFAQKVFLKTTPFRFGLMYWQAAKSFQSPQGHVFDNSNPFPQAVRGWYGAAKWWLFRGVEIKGYKLLKKDLWRSYQNVLPTIKDEWLVQAQIDWQKRAALFRMRQKKEGRFIRNYYRLHYAQQAGKTLRLQTRIEYVTVQAPAEHGMYLFQDIRWSGLRRLRLSARFTVFSTASFKSVLYEYENDLPGSFSNYALYGRGHLWYVMLRVQVVQNTTIWLKFRYLKQRDDYSAPRHIQRNLRMGLRYGF